jgi:signal peptidase I
MNPNLTLLPHSLIPALSEARQVLSKKSFCKMILEGLHVHIEKKLRRRRYLEENQSKASLKKKSTFREYAEAAAIAVLLALFIRTFVVQAFKIPSGSMEPTLMVGDHILVNKFIYGIKIPFIRKTLIPMSRPDREDIIVFIYPVDKSKDFIKRVIGLPGDTVEIIGEDVRINGRPYKDKHGFYNPGDKSGNNPGNESHYGPVTVPENHFFVMGDNRDHSYDSRYWGFVPFQSIKGKAFIIYWSWPHWQRFLHIIN